MILAIIIVVVAVAVASTAWALVFLGGIRLIDRLTRRRQPDDMGIKRKPQGPLSR